jgi:hypothetical protein
MQMRMIVLIIGLSFLFSNKEISKQNMKDKVEEYLRKIYPEKKSLQEGEFQYAGRTEIVSLSANDLGKCSKQWKFYRTHLQTAYFEFPTVEVLIAIDTENPNDVYLLKSLSYEPPDPRFYEVFYGCSGLTKREQETLAHAITKLLGSVAVQPEIEELSSNDNEVTIRINQANGSYVDFAYMFNAKGGLNKILSSGN